ncbi:nucleolar protein 4-like [Octopus bimaculoides]|uniref:nucleolar protein 4-like n=1 Tax=Octopus bimaculoides TaxID=37653 RepID=UPI0022E911DE|nr:nucleolar protein 4-like [Octopus bimaculoides]
MVPISKQPKDKIQAILEACDRQFPEFHERSRKRIRTYLKSCRRMRRSKEQNGWEPLRPTPPHLTSAAAEGILATACENESNNAKRMRMGLEPLPASAVQQLNNSGVLGGVGGSSGGGNIGGNNNSNNSNSNNSNSSNNNNNNSSSNNNSGTGAGGNGSGGCATPSGQNANSQNTAHQLSSANQAQSQSQTGSHDRSVVSSTGNDFIRHQPPTFRPPPEFHPPFFPNSNGIFRPGFTTGYQHPAHHHPPVIQHTPIQHNSVQNGKWRLFSFLSLF